MKRVLAICSSPIQIMFVVNLKNTLLKNDQIDIVFTDTLNGYKEMSERCNKYQLFHNSFTADSFDLSRRKGKYKKRSAFHDIIFLYKREKYVQNILPIKSSYDLVLFNNIDDFTNGVYNMLYKQNNKIQLWLFEDGFSTYCIQGKAIISGIKKYSTLFYKILYTVLRLRSVVMNINGQYLYDVEGIEWDAGFSRVQTPKFNPNDENVLIQLNQLFGYEKMQDKYNEPIIFFEESYRTEGIPINDIDIVEKVAEWVGKENILVKTHPRNKDNIFNKHGFKTNKNTSIPWEIIYMNNPDMENKLLLSVASGSLATPYTMLGKEPNSVVLLNMKQINPTGSIPAYYDYLSRKVFGKRADIFSCPINEEELKNIVIEFMNRKR